MITCPQAYSGSVANWPFKRSIGGALAVLTKESLSKKWAQLDAPQSKPRFVTTLRAAGENVFPERTKNTISLPKTRPLSCKLATAQAQNRAEAIASSSSQQ